MTSFSVTFDYRCPFARNAHEAVIAGVRAGKDWDVTYVPFSLDQAKVRDEEPAVWDREPAERGSGVLALQWGLAVRDRYPDAFLDFHLATFAARHDEARRITDEPVLREVAERCGLDPDAVAAEVAGGGPLKTLAAEHTDAVRTHGIWGVPTFVVDGEAAFVRFMERGDPGDVERMLALVPWAGLNEFKRPTIPR